MNYCITVFPIAALFLQAESGVMQGKKDVVDR